MRAFQSHLCGFAVRFIGFNPVLEVPKSANSNKVSAHMVRNSDSFEPCIKTFSFILREMAMSTRSLKRKRQASHNHYTGKAIHSSVCLYSYMTQIELCECPVHNLQHWFPNSFRISSILSAPFVIPISKRSIYRVDFMEIPRFFRQRSIQSHQANYHRHPTTR